MDNPQTTNRLDAFRYHPQPTGYIALFDLSSCGRETDTRGAREEDQFLAKQIGRALFRTKHSMIDFVNGFLEAPLQPEIQHQLW